MQRPGLDALSRALDDDIIAISGAKLQFNRAGTSDPLAVYDSPDLDSSLGYIITADAAGAFPSFWFDPTNDYDAVLQQADGTHIKTFANISVGTTAQSGRRAENGAPSYALFDYMEPAARARVLARDWTGDIAADMQEAVNAADLIMLHSATYPLVGQVSGDRYTFYGEARFAESLEPYGLGGAVVDLSSEDDTPFLIGEGVTHQALALNYVDQRDTTAGVIEYPVTYQNIDDTTTVAGFELKDIVVLGAYDFVQIGGIETFNKGGQIDFTGVRGAILNRAFTFQHIPDIVHFNHCKWSWGIMGDEFNHFGNGGTGAILDVVSITRTGSTADATLDAAHGRAVGDTVTIRNMDQAAYNVEDVEITGVPAANRIQYTVVGTPTTPATGDGKCHVFPMRDFYRDNATWMYVPGNGSTTSLSTVPVDGLEITANHFLGQKTLFYIEGEGADPLNPTGGFLQIVNMTGCIIDQIQELLHIEPGGAVSVFNVTGINGFQLRIKDDTWSGPLVYIEDPAPGPGNASLTSVRLTSFDMGFMNGTLSDISGDYFRALTVQGFTCPACCHSTENGDRIFNTIDAPDGDFVFSEMDVKASTRGGTVTGTRTFVHIINARSVRVDGVFEDWDCIIKNDSKTCQVDGHIDSFGDKGDAIQGAYAGNVRIDPRSEIESMPTLAHLRGESPVINGAFDLWRRGATSFVSGAIQFTADRWKFVRGSAAAGATLSRQTGFNDARYSARLQRDNGNSGVEPLYFCQQIPTQDCFQYQGADFFVGVDIRKGANFSAADGILTVRVFTGTGADETVNVATGFATGNVTQDKTIAPTTTGERFVVGPFAIASGATEIAYEVTFTPVGTAGAADYVELTRVSAGFLATAQDYVDRPLQQEVALAEFFYRRVGRDLIGRWSSATTVVLHGIWNMFKTPTPSLVSTTPIVAEVGVANRTGTASTLVASSGGARGGFYTIDGFSSATGGNLACGSQDEILILDAEIGP